MKKIFLILIILFVAGCTYSQNKSKKTDNGFIGSIGLNFSFPAEKKVFPQIADIIGTTPFIAAGYVFDGYTAARFEFNYNSFSDFPIKPENEKLGGSFRAYSFKAEFLAGLLKKKGPIDIYGITGIGYHSFSQSKQGEISLVKDESNLGLTIGAGINFRYGSKFGVSWEAQYNALFGNETLHGYFNLSTLNFSFRP